MQAASLLTNATANHTLVQPLLAISSRQTIKGLHFVLTKLQCAYLCQLPHQVHHAKFADALFALLDADFAAATDAEPPQAADSEEPNYELGFSLGGDSETVTNGYFDDQPPSLDIQAEAEPSFEPQPDAAQSTAESAPPTASAADSAPAQPAESSSPLVAESPSAGAVGAMESDLAASSSTSAQAGDESAAASMQQEDSFLSEANGDAQHLLESPARVADPCGNGQDLPGTTWHNPVFGDLLASPEQPTEVTFLSRASSACLLKTQEALCSLTQSYLW